MEREPALFIGRASKRPKYQQSITSIFDPLAPKFVDAPGTPLSMFLGTLKNFIPNIIFKGNRTLISSDKPKLKKNRKLRVGFLFGIVG